MSKRVVAVPLQGGKVAANPQFQDSLKQLGLDANKVVQEVQDRLKAYGKYPIQKVEIEVFGNKYDVKVYLPPVGDLFLKLFNKDTGAHDARNEVIGNLSFEQLVEISVLKKDELKSRTLKAAVKQLISTCKAMGVSIDGKKADDVLKEVEAGNYDEVLKKFEPRWGL